MELGTSPFSINNTWVFFGEESWWPSQGSLLLLILLNSTMSSIWFWALTSAAATGSFVPYSGSLWRHTGPHLPATVWAPPVHVRTFQIFMAQGGGEDSCLCACGGRVELETLWPSSVLPWCGCPMQRWAFLQSCILPENQPTSTEISRCLSSSPCSKPFGRF